MFYIINTITGEEFKTQEELNNLFNDLIEREKTFKIADLFLNKLTDLKIIEIK